MVEISKRRWNGGYRRYYRYQVVCPPPLLSFPFLFFSCRSDEAELWAGTFRNFTKFIVDKDGKVVGRYAPTTKPEALKAAIEALL
jgi:hypothetical protein